MRDEELGELGLSQNAMHQLRSIINRLQSINGVNNMNLSFLSKQPPAHVSGPPIPPTPDVSESFFLDLNLSLLSHKQS